MSNDYVPERGDIVFTDFDPSAGHEQAHERPALILTIQRFNSAIGLALVAPITSRVRGSGMEVIIDTDLTKGAILCQQIKMIDFNARGVNFVEKAPADVLSHSLAKVRAFVA